MYVKNEYMQRNDKLKIIFMGTPAYATTILRALVHESSIEVPLLVTQEDKPVGRKQILTPPHIKAWALEENLCIDIYQPKSLRTEEAREKIASYKPDFIVVAAYGKLLPKEILDIAPCINLHASLLPKYRGASPIQSTLLAGDVYAGVTSMLMEEGLDTGAMLGFSYHAVQKHESAGDLFECLAHHAALLSLQTLKHFSTLAPLKQQEVDASHCKKIKKEDGLICFETQSAQEIVVKSRALSPWPGIFLESGLKLHDIELCHCDNQFLPSVISMTDKNGIVVSCKDNCLLIKTLQPLSKSVMKAVDYIRGKRLVHGDRLV